MHHCSPHPPGCRATSSAALDPHQQENRMSKQKKKKKSSTKKKKSWFQKHVSRTSSSLSTNQSQLIKVLVLIGIAGLCVLSVINFGLRAISNQKLQTQEALRQEQLSKKEQETNKLANQRQKAKEAAALVIEKISDETNAYQLSNIQSDVKKLDLSNETKKHSISFGSSVWD